MSAWPVRFIGLLLAILLMAGCNTPAKNPAPAAPVPLGGKSSRPHGSHTDERTGLIFPADISRWIFTDVRTYEPASLGVSYGYKSKLQRLGAITCYVYDRGVPAIPNGGASPLVRREMFDTIQSVVPGAQQRGAITEELMPISDVRKGDGTVLALVAAHRLIDQGVTNISISAVTGYRGQFLKIRFTFPGNNLQDALTGPGGLAEFVAEMRATNQATLDSFFLAGGQD